MVYPHRLSASTVSVVCARENCVLPAQQHQQQVYKDNCIDYYISADPSSLPPPPPSSCSQISQPISCKGCELNTDCKCLLSSQTIMQQDANPRFRKIFESNGVDQRVMSRRLLFIICRNERFFIARNCN